MPFFYKHIVPTGLKRCTTGEKHIENDASVKMCFTKSYLAQVVPYKHFVYGSEFTLSPVSRYSLKKRSGAFVVILTTLVKRRNRQVVPRRCERGSQGSLSTRLWRDRHSLEQPSGSGS